MHEGGPELQFLRFFGGIFDSIPHALEILTAHLSNFLLRLADRFFARARILVRRWHPGRGPFAAVALAVCPPIECVRPESGHSAFQP
jgi:hypothetical protein